jgi:LmbE family N-acetylglucosaminyl deacetylase
MTDFLVGPDARVLVVAAHADDEALGAGGTIARARAAGAAVQIFVCSHAVHSRNLEAGVAAHIEAQRRTATQKAASHLGATLTLLDLPDNAFDTVPLLDLVQVLEAVMSHFRPTAILSHFAADLSRDHELVQRAVMTAARPIPGRAPSLLSFEIRSATDWAVGGGAPFAPSVWVALDERAWQTKLELLDIYADELRAWPHARSVEGIDALARYRGSQVGVDRAEAFALLRTVVP